MYHTVIKWKLYNHASESEKNSLFVVISTSNFYIIHNFIHSQAKISTKIETFSSEKKLFRNTGNYGIMLSLESPNSLDESSPEGK